MTIRKGRIIPSNIRRTPRLRRKRGDLHINYSRGERILSSTRFVAHHHSCAGRVRGTILIQPASHKMLWLRLEVGRELHIA
jgi:hypothetical protein